MLNIFSWTGAISWFLPGILASSFAAWFARSFVARYLGTSRVGAFLFMVSLGAVLSATVTPIHAIVPTEGGEALTCDLSRIGLASPADLRTINDTSLNILLFIPLGLATGFVPSSRRKVALMTGLVALPFGIEAIQLAAPALERGCQSADVVDNLTGFAAGVAVSSIARLAGRLTRHREPADRQ